MAKKKEQLAWENFAKHINGRLNCKRVENQINDGMSDVTGINRNGTAFWIENKALEAWPKRASTQPLRGVFEPGQIPFLKEWRSWGGRSFVLLRVGKEYLLLNPKPRSGAEPELVDQTVEQVCLWRLADGIEGIIEYLECLS